ncbi:MAG: glycosyltransferase family 2 protein [Pseudomonadota bacterium]
MSSNPTWGVVSTIKAPATDILNFAAYHLDLGAQRVFIYLDAPNDAAFAALKNHPKCRVIVTNDGYWKRRKGRPDKHQPRQTANATHCYNRDPQVDWLAHIDADEFLWSPKDRPIADQLADVPADARSARVKPIEALENDPTDPPPPGQVWCKGHARHLRPRRAETNAIYPTYGDHLNGGFLSHVAGKVFVRTGAQNVSFRIHNAFFDGEADPDPAPLDDMRLVHMHAHSWDHFQALYQFRLAQGSYRESLKPAPMPDGVALNMNQLFAALEEDGGEKAVRAFFTEVCTATPDLRAQLAEYDHLYAVTLDLDAKREKHFADAV